VPAIWPFGIASAGEGGHPNVRAEFPARQAARGSVGFAGPPGKGVQQVRQMTR
jgi:hypothetical protein